MNIQVGKKYLTDGGATVLVIYKMKDRERYIGVWEDEWGERVDRWNSKGHIVSATYSGLQLVIEEKETY